MRGSMRHLTRPPQASPAAPTSTSRRADARMTTYQRRLLALAAANVALVLLFPPFDSFGLGLGRTSATFDAFYFVFDDLPNKTINLGLLALQLTWIAANTALGWSLLRPSRPAPTSGHSLLSARNGVAAFAVLNLIIILLVPPFENYASVLRITGTYFDGFYLAFGDKWQRRFYVPLLYLEILWLLVNAAALWLLLRPADEQAATPSAEGPATIPL